MPPAASRRLPCRPVTTCDPARRRGRATRCRLARPRGRATSALPVTPAFPARACRGRPWDPADRSARVVPCHLATPPTSPRQARARTSTKVAEPGGMRAVPATPLRAAAGQDSRGTRDLRDLLKLLTSLTAATPTSSARQITRSGRPAPCVRRASAGPRTRLRQASRRPADPARSSESDVYVYRDTGGQPDDPAAAAPGPDEHDASYWYDLPGTSAGGDTTARVPQETRGPFEPLVSSADPPGTTPRISASLDDAEPAAPEAAYSQEAPPAAETTGSRTRRTTTRASLSRSRTCT